MDDEDLKRRFEAAVGGSELDDLRELGGNVVFLADRLPRPERPELRRPARSEPVTYRVRVDLDHARPPIWRLLEIRSDLTLDVVHTVLQAAYGWADAHLHRFSLGAGPFDRESQLFLCPFDVEEGEDDGAPAADVRLDEVLQEPGDELRYVYDYGDHWELVLRLEDILPVRTEHAVCVDGERAAPPEDCGGLTEADDLAQVLDDPAAFDRAEVNAMLRAELGVNPVIRDLLRRLQHTPSGGALALVAARLTAPVEQPGIEEKAASLHAFQWFLDRAADGGLELTGAGYLKPADVTAAAAVVPTMADWYGKANREVNCQPLLEFRQALQSLGLLRKHKGRLLLTRAGASVRGDAEALFRHLASRLVPSQGERFDREATLLLLAYAASAEGELPLGEVAEALSDLGWRRGEARLQDYDLYHVPVRRLLVNVTDRPVTFRDRDRLSPVASALARAALGAPG